jgi:hypothetical protein
MWRLISIRSARRPERATVLATTPSPTLLIGALELNPFWIVPSLAPKSLRQLFLD